MRVRTTAAALAASALAAATAIPAGAADPVPTAGCFGLAATDKAGDQTSEAPAAQQGARENLDILEGFFLSEPGKASTVNIRVSDLSKTIPTGANAISWYTELTVDGNRSWIRAMTDFSGIVAYDYGHFEPGPGAVISEFSVRDGESKGELFEGPKGVVQIELPVDTLGKPGAKISNIIFHAYEMRQGLPTAAPTAVKGGFLYDVDDATAKGTFSPGAPCPATTPPPPPASTGTTTAGGPPLGVGNGPLPVKVLTKKVKRAKKLTLKLRSSEALTKIGARLLKGKKVVAKGSLAKLNGNGKLKLKAKKLKKGTYRLDLVGTDSKGARRFTAAKLTVR